MLDFVITCPKILTCDADLRDDGFWQMAYDVEICSFIYIGGYHSLEI